MALLPGVHDPRARRGRRSRGSSSAAPSRPRPSAEALEAIAARRRDHHRTLEPARLDRPDPRRARHARGPRRRRAPVIAVSPIVAGEVLKGPTASFMAFAALGLSADGIVDFYGELLDGIVADERAAAVPALQTDTRMDNPQTPCPGRRRDARFRRRARRLTRPAPSGRARLP